MGEGGPGEIEGKFAGLERAETASMKASMASLKSAESVLRSVSALIGMIGQSRESRGEGTPSYRLTARAQASRTMPRSHQWAGSASKRGCHASDMASASVFTGNSKP